MQREELEQESEENVMSQQVDSVAILEALPGREDELIAMLREVYTMMQAKGYCTDVLYREGGETCFFHLRRWKSAELRSGPDRSDVHRYWQQLPDLCTIPLSEDLEILFEISPAATD
jgi:hypothetical protein